MPLEEQWFQQELTEWVGQLNDLRESYSDEYDTNQIVAEFKDINPDVMGNRLIFFSASRHTKAKWMTFRRDVEALGVEMNNSAIGKFFHIQERPVQYEIDDELVDSIRPIPLAVLDSEATAFEIFESLPKTKRPALSMPDVDIDTEVKLVSLYQSLGGKRETFVTVVKSDPAYLPEGLTADQAFSLAKKQAQAQK